MIGRCSAQQEAQHDEDREGQEPKPQQQVQRIAVGRIEIKGQQSDDDKPDAQGDGKGADGAPHTPQLRPARNETMARITPIRQISSVGIQADGK